MTATFKISRGSFKCKNESGNKNIDKDSLDEFWEEIGSGDGKGVYVFGVKAAKGWKPLYVGRTKKQNFKERMNQHIKYKGADFDNMLKGIKKGIPVLFTIQRVGQGKPSNSVIDELEMKFINYAFARNKNLHNDRGIRRPTYVVLGLGGRGKPPTEVTELRSMIGY